IGRFELGGALDHALLQVLVQSFNPGVEALVQAPGGDAGEAGAEHESRVDAGPLPRVQPGVAMVIHRLRLQHTDHTVVYGYVGDGQQVRAPALVQRDHRDHDEEVEVHLDDAAGEVHEDGGAGDEPGAGRQGAPVAAQPGPTG